MTRSDLSLSRARRVLVAMTMATVASPLSPAGVAAAGSGPSSGATGGSPAASEAALTTQAQEISSELNADGVRLAQLDEAYNAAQLNLESLINEQAKLVQAMSATAGAFTTAKQALEHQAIFDYIAGDGPLTPFVAGHAGLDPSLTLSYADIIAGGQKSTLQSYKQLLGEQTQQSSSLRAEEEQAQVTLADIANDESSAAQTVAQRKRTLAGVQGRLATAVAEVQAQQQHAEQSALETSLASQGQLPGADGAAPGGVEQPSGSTTSRPAAGSPPTAGPPPTSPPTVPPTPTTTVPAGRGDNQPAPGWQLAVHYAYEQLGKPYQWGGAGPNSFDCSGLTMMAWEQAGVYFPHLAQDQYEMTERIPFSDLLPGDLVFYGDAEDVYHVGLYIGNGDMIAAPETGQVVSIQSIYWGALFAAGRVRS